jgi:hypothetical protein
MPAKPSHSQNFHKFHQIGDFDSLVFHVMPKKKGLVMSFCKSSLKKDALFGTSSPVVLSLSRCETKKDQLPKLQDHRK